METLFTLSNLLVLPFWLLMILLPRWQWTQRIMNSLWVVVPTAALYAVLLLSQLASASEALLDPTLAGIAALLGQPAGAVVAWLHLLTFDLFAGRWAYLDGRERGYSPWLMSPILFFILMAGPFGFLLYLAVRSMRPARGRRLGPAIFPIVAIFFIAGCAVGNATSITPTTTSVPPPVEATTFKIPTEEHFTPPEIATRTPRPTLTLSSPTPSLPTNTSTPIVTSIPEIAPNGMSPLRVCATLPQRITTRDETGILNSFSHLRFVDEETIIFAGWGARPRPTPDPMVTPATPLPPFSSGVISSWTAFKWGKLDLASSEVITYQPDFVPLLQNPCTGSCVLDIVSQSPDQLWQLVQVSAAESEAIGFWLAGRNELVRLVNYVPGHSTWQWAADSSLFRLTHSLYEYGLDTILAELDTSPLNVINPDAGVENPLFNATWYIAAFDTIEKTIWLSPSSEAFPNTAELFLFDLSQSFTQSVTSKVLPGIKTVVWNESTETYLFLIVKDDGLEIADMSSQVLVRVPIETFEQLFPALATSDGSFGNFLPYDHFALSTSGRYLAIGYGGVTGIYVFDCQANTLP